MCFSILFNRRQHINYKNNIKVINSAWFKMVSVKVTLLWSMIVAFAIIQSVSCNPTIGKKYGNYDLHFSPLLLIISLIKIFNSSLRFTLCIFYLFSHILNYRIHRLDGRFWLSGNLHSELRSVQENVRIVFRGSDVRRCLCQVQGKDYPGLWRHRIDCAVPDQIRLDLCDQTHTIAYTYASLIIHTQRPTTAQFDLIIISSLGEIYLNR